jgi:hypothetical protein
MTLTVQSTLTVVSVLLFVGLAIFTTFWLTSAGLGPFDGQALGYGFNAAQSYLDDLTPDQRSLYLGPYRIADTIFPAVLTATLVLWFCTKTTGLFRAGCVAFTGAFLVADYVENMLVSRLIMLGADGITSEGVAFASALTQVKWAGLILCPSAAIWVWFKRRKGDEA